MPIPVRKLHAAIKYDISRVSSEYCLPLSSSAPLSSPESARQLLKAGGETVGVKSSAAQDRPLNGSSRKPVWRNNGAHGSDKRGSRGWARPQYVEMRFERGGKQGSEAGFAARAGT